eukprot:2479198-Pleurochrysis_carterae.AAC.1
MPAESTESEATPSCLTSPAASGLSQSAGRRTSRTRSPTARPPRPSGRPRSEERLSNPAPCPA